MVMELWNAKFAWLQNYKRVRISHFRNYCTDIAPQESKKDEQIATCKSSSKTRQK